MIHIPHRNRFKNLLALMICIPNRNRFKNKLSYMFHIPNRNRLLKCTFISQAEIVSKMYFHVRFISQTEKV